MSDQQDIFNIRRQMSSADHEVVTVSRNIVTKSSLTLPFAEKKHTLVNNLIAKKKKNEKKITEIKK